MDTQTSETRESDDYYANLKRLELEKAQQEAWQTDKSDLDSLDSNYFKNSLHQPTIINVAKTSEIKTSKTSSSDSQHTHKYQVLEIEVHNQNIRHSVSTTETTTTTTTATSSDQSSDHYSSNTRNEETDSLQNTSSAFEDVILTSEKETSDYSAHNSCELNINYNTLTLSRHKIQSGDSDSGTFDKKQKFKEDRKSVVSYDSIYLSSEGSNDHTTVDEKIDDPLPEIRISSDGEFVDIEIDEFDEEQHQQQDTSGSDSTVNVDSLYSQIIKSKPKILSLEPKSNLTSFSDTSTRGTLERLTFISSSAQQKEYQQIEGKLFSTEPFVGTLVDNQYCSLPDANIGISLRASERIDAKLRLSCNVTGSSNTNSGETVSGEDNNNLIYDSISRFGRAHKRLRQRENFEIVVLNPISIDEQPKEAPSIEVKQPRIEVTPPAKEEEEVELQQTIKVESEPIKFTKESKPKEILPTKICLGKKQVIVDELAAKVERNNQTIKEITEQKQTVQKKNISKTTLRTSNDIKIIVTDTQNNIVEETTTKVTKTKQIDIESYVPPPPFVQEALKKVAVKTTQKSQNNIVEEKTIKHIDQEVVKKVAPKPQRSLTDLTQESFDLRKNIKDSILKKDTKPKTIHDVQLTPIPKKEDLVIAKKALFQKSIISGAESSSEQLRKDFKANLSDTLKKRIAESRNIFNARPIRISSVDNIEKLNDTYEIHPSLTYKVKFKEQANNMSRPQILNVVDTKRSVCSVAPRTSLTEPDAKIHEKLQSPEAQQEFQEKVDSVRYYWSKLIDTKDQEEGVDEVDRSVPPPPPTQAPQKKEEKEVKVRTFVTSVDEPEQNSTRFKQQHERGKTQLRDTLDGVSSFSPMVEIIELDGHKQAAVVNASNMDNQDFDHVRYKVMKSDTFQKNILTHSRKEAQFDGLLQYLNDYSFQVSFLNNIFIMIITHVNDIFIISYCRCH